MLTEVRVKNPNRLAEQELTLPRIGPSKYPIVFIDGLGPVTSEFSSSPYANLPGEYLQSSRVGTRNIVLTLDLKPDYSVGEDAEALRQQLLTYFTPGQEVEFEFVTDKTTRLISGVVESMEAPMFVRLPQVQISVICHDPYFRAVADLDGSDIVGTHLGASIGDAIDVENSGNVPVGFRLELQPLGALSRIDMFVPPSHKGLFVVNTVFPTNHIVAIDTRARQKEVRNLSNGVNHLADVIRGSSWPMLAPGMNQIQLSIQGSFTLYNYTISFERRYTSL